MPSVYKKSKLIGGQFQDASGNPLSLGKLVWLLSHDENVSTLGGPSGLQVASGQSTTSYLDMNGNIASTFYIWANSTLTPEGSYYLVKAYDSSGLEVWVAPQVFVLNYAPTIDVGTLTPVTPD